jgi:hypothetical protein
MVATPSGATSWTSKASEAFTEQRLEDVDTAPLRASERHHLADRRVPSDVKERLAFLGTDQDRARLAVARDEHDLLGGEHDVDRVDDRAEFGDCMVADKPFGGVQAIEGNPVAGRHPEPDQGIGEPVGIPLELGIGERALADHQRGLVTVARRRARQNLPDPPEHPLAPGSFCSFTTPSAALPATAALAPLLPITHSPTA